MADLYTARATAKGARSGHVRSDDGKVDFDLSIPEDMGGPGGPGTNPEQLFAAGYSACFQGALTVAGSKFDVDTSDSEVTVEVDLGPPSFTLAARIFVRIPGVDHETATKLVESAHRTCPYSRATSGNIDVQLSVVD